MKGRLAGAAVALIALVALGGGALHANADQTKLTSAREVAAAARADTYYACLTTQAHSLIGTHDVVYLHDPSLDQWVVLTKVIGGWATETLHLDRATVALSLQHIGGHDGTGSGTCQGDVLVAVRRGPGGRVELERGGTGHGRG
jgi:hypothetical protein